MAHEIGETCACQVFDRLSVDPREAPPGARETVANQLAGRLADCTCAEVAGCGNLIHWLEPESLMRYVLGFLGSL